MGVGGGYCHYCVKPCGQVGGRGREVGYSKVLLTCLHSNLQTFNSMHHFVAEKKKKINAFTPPPPPLSSAVLDTAINLDQLRERSYNSEPMKLHAMRKQTNEMQYRITLQTCWENGPITTDQR